MNHGCPFEYFKVDGFLGMDMTMDIAWILRPGGNTKSNPSRLQGKGLT